jgi:hypothetical protein
MAFHVIEPSWVTDVLKQVHPDSGIETRAVQWVVQQLAVIMSRLSDGPIRTLLRRLMPGDLGKHAECEMDKASRKPSSLIFKVDGVDMSAVLEYICAELLELAGNAARDFKRSRIALVHMELAVRNDEELYRLIIGKSGTPPPPRPVVEIRSQKTAVQQFVTNVVKLDPDTVTERQLANTAGWTAKDAAKALGLSGDSVPTTKAAMAKRLIQLLGRG